MTPTETVIELRDGLLTIGEKIDSCDQSRLALSDTMDEIRETVVELYGDDFETDLLEHLGYETDAADDSDAEEGD